MKYNPLKYALFLMLAFFAVISHAEQAIPPIGWVSDADDVLTQTDRNIIVARAAALDNQTKAVIATVIVRSLDGETIESYAQRVAQAWSPGYENDNRGAILVIAVNDRKVRIETSKNISTTLTDSRTNQIIGEMKPYLKDKNWTQAVLVFYRGVQPYVGLPPEQAKQKAEQDAIDDEHTRKGITIIIAVVALFAALAGIVFWRVSIRHRKAEAVREEHDHRKAQVRETQARVERKERLILRANEAFKPANPHVVTSNQLTAYSSHPEATAKAYYSSDPQSSRLKRTTSSTTKRRSDDSNDSFYTAVAVAASAEALYESSRRSSYSSGSSDNSWSSPSSDSSSGSSYDGGGSSSDF